MTESRNNIVVVDYDTEMTKALKTLLAAAGLHALSFESAEALLQADAARRAACLVLEICLPGLSGFELQKRLIQNGVRRPTIFITAYADPDSQARAERAGAIAFFTKPFSGPDLIAAVTKALATE